MLVRNWQNGLAAAISLASALVLTADPKQSDPSCGEAGANKQLRVTKAQRPRPEAYPKDILVLPVAEESRRLNKPNTTPDADLEILQVLLQEYRRSLTVPPSGENTEIVSALTGVNSRGLAVLRPNHPSIRRDGQLVDRWGTPYFFHVISDDTVEIISAGPDRTLWTKDDIRNDPRARAGG